ncbi:protein TolQ [Salinicola halophilus]|uniref:protein TolQ n=1 Tax=Salinicola halophilus TaxID=184065 RepID=UPI000DA26353|nr:protein TolQ [Salinicola halophilus]
MQSAVEQITVWSLITDASPLVQGVMLILLLASIVSWYLIIRRSGVMRRSEREFHRFQRTFRDSRQLTPLMEKEISRDAGMGRIFQSGYAAYTALNATPGIAPDSLIEGVDRTLAVAVAEQEERLEKGLPMLATIGSVSPYIGLFGTVWGIMNSFLGLSQVEQVTLATVAPGIAEALIATAIGLFAAIPAVIAYNRFSARNHSLVSRYYAFANELQARLHCAAHSDRQPLPEAA